MIRDFIRQLLNLPDAVVERPENPNFGDYSTSAVLKLSKQQGCHPMELAQEMAQNIRLSDSRIFSKIEVAPPGFINFTLSPEFLQNQVSVILSDGQNYGKNNLGGGQKIQVEFISANPTGPLTLGNGRGGFFGDVLANVLARAGFDVKREYFVNDAGHQIEVLGHSILGNDKAQYKGRHIDDLRDRLKVFLNEEPKIIGERAAAIIMDKMIKPTIAERMKIKFDNWVSEMQEIHQDKALMDEIRRRLLDDNLIYEQEGATWFKSTEFGDDKDRVLITSGQTDKNGEPTYFLADIVYHYKKFVEDKFDKVVDIWGADHHGYITRLQAAGKALGEWDEKKLEIIIMQLVRLIKGGQEVKMSKRLGTYITLDELLDEIPLDVVRFFFLMRAPNTHMDFDLDLAKEQSDKNPVYYVQYAHARLCSILRKAKDNSLPLPEGEIRRGRESYQLLAHPSELNLIKQLIRLPEIIADTAQDYQVHRLPQYSLDLVRSFHKFYEDCKVLDESNKDLTFARLALCKAVKIVLKNVFDLMGISAPEKM